MKKLYAGLLALLIFTLAPVHNGVAAIISPGQATEQLRSALIQAQLALGSDPPQAQTGVDGAERIYKSNLAAMLAATDPALAERIQQGFVDLRTALAQQDGVGFAAARADLWSTLLVGSYQVVTTALVQQDAQTAQQWLPVREFRTATRFARLNTDATLAIDGVISGKVSLDQALVAVQADLLDAYQARLNETLQDLADADASNFGTRRAELATLAAGYFDILAPAYAEQRGAEALTTATATFAQLRTTALTGTRLTSALDQVATILQNFRAAPLSPTDQARRASQLLRYLPLVAVEYGRGVVDGRVTKALEIQEALTFQTSAQAAFTDLQNLLHAQNAEQTAIAAALMAALDQQLTAASTGGAVIDPANVQATVDQVTELLRTIMPPAWQQAGSSGDFDVIASLLDQMENAVRAGDYLLAESARIEAYAVMETGPEARLMIFAPALKLRLEELFWSGQGASKGLAYLLRNQEPLSVIRSTRAALSTELASAQAMLAESSAPAAIFGNAAIIVFREGLEAVLILASLMGSMKVGESRRYRKPLWWGTALAFVGTVLTWLLARGVLVALARYGEKLEAVVSLIAIAVLLLITNWFFHKMYWNDWLANFHTRKRQLLSGEAGLFVGLVVLGFTSVYREGFETVLFLQALVLEAGTALVLGGVALGLLGTVLVGVIAFALQARLPYMKMLVATGIMIGGVLLMMVGTTVHVLQVIGWLPIHVISGLSLPVGLGTWLGIYPTWEGIGLQIAAAVFVIGSYYWAEHLNHTRRPKANTVNKGNETLTAAGAV